MEALRPAPRPSGPGTRRAGPAAGTPNQEVASRGRINQAWRDRAQRRARRAQVHAQWALPQGVTPVSTTCIAREVMHMRLKNSRQSLADVAKRFTHWKQHIPLNTRRPMTAVGTPAGQLKLWPNRWARTTR